MTMRGTATWGVVALLQAILIVLLAVDLFGAGPAEDSTVGGTGVEESDAESADDVHGDTGLGSAREASAADRVPVAVDPATPQVPAASPNGTAVLFGRVIDGEGEPVAARLTLHSGKDRLVSLTADGKGHYAIPGLAPGSYELTASATDQRPASVPVEVPSGVDRMRRDVVMESSWRLVVRFVTPEGKPFHEVLGELREAGEIQWGVQVEALATVDAPPASFPASTRSSSPFGIGRWRAANGPFGGASLPSDCAGLIELEERQPLHVSAVLRDFVLATAQVEAGQENVTLTVTPELLLSKLGTVRLRVVDADTGAPVPGARVDLSDAQTSSMGKEVESDGSIVLTNRRPGKLEITIRDGERFASQWELDLEPGADVDLGDLVIGATVPLVVEFEGPPDDAECYVYVRSLESAPHPSLTPHSMRFGNHKRRFERSIPAGRWRFDAICSGWAGRIEIDTSTLGEGPLTLRFEPTVSLRIVPPTPASNLELELTHADGRVWVRQWLTFDRPFPREMPAGNYTAVLRGLAGSEVSRRPVVVAEGAELDLR